jgi:AcrR family transcriptional regulator
MNDTQVAAEVLQQVPSGKLERTRQRLVHSIREEIAASGNFTGEQVAARAGTSVATFYNHFDSRETALIAAYESLMQDLVALVREHCRIERLLDRGLHGFLATWLTHATAFFGANSALFRLAQGATTTSRGMRDVFRRNELLVLEHYDRFIELGQAASLIRAGDRRSMAEVLLVLSESWNHPRMRGVEPGCPLHREWTRSLVRILAPEDS